MRMRACGLVLCGALSLMVGSQSASADWMEATLNQPLKEIAHHVEVHFAKGVATYNVRRTFLNQGSIHDEASLRIKLPYGASATGLRIRAGDVWYEAELMEAEQAAARYQELTGLGSAVPKDPALLQWMWADELHLHVFPVPPGGTASVEYTLAVPTSYEKGRAQVTYPMRDPERGELADPTLNVTHEDPLAMIWLGDARVAQAQPMIMKAPARHKLCDAVSAEFSCVVSTLTMPKTPWSVKTMELELDIRHTYRSDLQVQLRAPGGRIYDVQLGGRGSENDVKGVYKVELMDELEVGGEWALIVMDTVALDSGRLEFWALAGVGGQAKQRTSRVRVPTALIVPDASDNQGVAIISASPREDLNMMDGRLGAVRMIKGKQFLRAELDMARQLSKMPTEPHVVFVMDGSFSIGAAGVSAQLELMRAFLRHVPDAKVEVMLYQRQAKPVFGEFVDVDELESKLKAWEEGAFDQANGSQLDAALAMGLKALATSAKPGHAQYMVVMTDDLMRGGYQHKDSLDLLSKVAAKGVNVHVLDLELGSSFIASRNESLHAAPVALKSGGLSMKVRGLPSGEDKDKARSLVQFALSLVRPTSIDEVRWSAPGLKFEDFKGWPAQLEEGQGMRRFESLKVAPTSLTLKGKLWNRPFERTFKNLRWFERLAAGWIFPHDLTDALDDAEQFKLAMYAGVVSPVTSFLAVEPGVRPSTVGIARGLSGRGMGGGGTGFGRMGTIERKLKALNELLRDGVDDCAAQLKMTGSWAIELDVETTLNEVVDVRVTMASAPSLSACVVERVWATRIPAYRETWKTHQVSFKKS